MCDYSLQSVKSRPAQVDDKLIVKDFGTGTRGFAAVHDIDPNTAVCLLPGTEVAFDEPIAVGHYGQVFEQTAHKVARFRQIRKDEARVHHDAIELPDGKLMLLHSLLEGQRATVLQLPAAPKNKAEAEEQKRVEFIG